MKVKTKMNETMKKPMISTPFSTLIEADHTYLTIQSRTLIQMTTLKTPPSLSQFHADLVKFTARLIRHDIIEDLIMRPAFEQHLGATGIAMARQDRSDHSEIKKKLLDILEAIDGRIAESEGKANRDGNDEEKNSEREVLRDVIHQLTPLMIEMRKHMREESGVSIPMLERVVGPEISRDLAREYALALVLDVDLEVLDRSATTTVPTTITDDTGHTTVGGGGGGHHTPISDDHRETKGKRKKCFPGGFDEYVTTRPDKFREIWKELRAEEREEDNNEGYLKRRVREELEILGIDRGDGWNCVDVDVDVDVEVERDKWKVRKGKSSVKL